MKRGGVQFGIGGTLAVLFVVLAVLAPHLAPYGIDDQDLLAALAPPDRAHPFGTDPLGRDVLSRVLVGLRSTLAVAVVSVAIAGAVGMLLGLTAGYHGGRTDRAMTACIDLLLTIPQMVLAIAIAAIAGAGLSGLIAAIAISFTPEIARIVRSRVLELREEEFVQAAIAVGMSSLRVKSRHVLPGTLTVFTVQLSLSAGQAVLVASALGFLGLGVPPPTPEWGTMLSEGRDYLGVATHLIVAPGLAISCLVVAFNLLGDGLRDLADPQARG